MKGKIFVIGLGPGDVQNMTFRAYEVLKQCEVLVGYTVYVEQIEGLCDGKEIIKKGMGQEIERCKIALEKALEGNPVGVVCSGDAGVYGMAGLVIELVSLQQADVEVEVVPGITAALSCSSLLGAPIVEDFCTISLSDYMIPWEKILFRLQKACEADFTIAIYNPRSKVRIEHLNEALEVIRKFRGENTPIGIVRKAYRKEQTVVTTTLKDLDVEQVDMFCTLIIGNSGTRIEGKYMVTSRGYQL